MLLLFSNHYLFLIIVKSEGKPLRNSLFERSVRGGGGTGWTAKEGTVSRDILPLSKTLSRSVVEPDPEPEPEP
jgi:hypothetical protein